MLQFGLLNFTVDKIILSSSSRASTNLLKVVLTSSTAEAFLGQFSTVTSSFEKMLKVRLCWDGWATSHLTITTLKLPSNFHPAEERTSQSHFPPATSAWQQALRRFSQALKQHPMSPVTWIRRGHNASLQQQSRKFNRQQDTTLKNKGLWFKQWN